MNKRAGKFLIFRSSQILILLISIFLVSACSSSLKRKIIGGDSDDEMVPKEQYNTLLRKYETLLKDRGTEKKEKITEVSTKKIDSKNSSGNGDKKAKKSVALDKVDLIDDLNEAVGLTETVDVFSNKNIGKSKRPLGPSVSDEIIEKEIAELRKAQGFLNQNKFDSALKILRGLESSEVRHIKVTAKFYIGELIFRQGDYDLSMQIFEEIIRRNAFSGIVLKALGRLIVCSEKLQLGKKKERYYSILHDFFGV